MEEVEFPIDPESADNLDKLPTEESGLGRGPTVTKPEWRTFPKKLAWILGKLYTEEMYSEVFRSEISYLQFTFKNFRKKKILVYACK